ncbi:MAG: Eco57I restriction-modification methylase domain-containing protein [Clostridiaceae bacterium]
MSSYKENYNPDILSCLVNLSNDEVFTPPEVANAVLDLLPREIWSDKSITFLDPCCKTGVFLREITKRLLEGLKYSIPDRQERINHILTKQVFGISITEITSLMTRRSLYCSKVANGKYSICTDFRNNSGNIYYKRLEHQWKDGQCIKCGASRDKYDRPANLENHAYVFIHQDIKEIFKGMKFDVVIGNPPYQLSDGGAQASAKPLYHEFVNLAKALNPRFITMIIPSRWFAGGKGLDAFRYEMLRDRRIRVIHDYWDASECFKGVEIKGGVCYFLWDRDRPGDCKVYSHQNNNVLSVAERPLMEEGCDIFIRINEAISIYKKIISFGEGTFDKILSAQKPFGLRTFYQGKDKPFTGSIKVYSKNKLITYIDSNDIPTNKDCIDKHKVIIPRAIGTGNSKDDNIKPLYCEPGSICTETFIMVGPFNTKEECYNVISYIRTKFFHFLVTLKKNTMMAPKAVYSFVPIQDFSKPWTDEELFKKYNLTEEEITCIRTLTPDFSKEAMSDQGSYSDE